MLTGEELQDSPILQLTLESVSQINLHLDICQEHLQRMFSHFQPQSSKTLNANAYMLMQMIVDLPMMTNVRALFLYLIVTFFLSIKFKSVSIFNL